MTVLAVWFYLVGLLYVGFMDLARKEAEEEFNYWDFLIAVAWPITVPLEMLLIMFRPEEKQ